MQNKIEVANKVDEGFDIIQLISSWINFLRKKRFAKWCRNSM